jgi:hypothetical protein
LTVSTDGSHIFRGTVDIVEHLGELTLLYVDCGFADPVIAKLDGNVRMARGIEIGLTAQTSVLHVFDENGVAFPRRR